MKTIADTLGVSRSQLACRVAGRVPRRGRYTKAADAWLLPMIRRIADGRASYGYRRVTALLNRELRQEGHDLVNHKRVYRLMSQNGLLLARHTGRGRQAKGIDGAETAGLNTRSANPDARGTAQAINAGFF